MCKRTSVGPTGLMVLLPVFPGSERISCCVKEVYCELIYHFLRLVRMISLLCARNKESHEHTLSHQAECDDFIRRHFIKLSTES